MANYISLTNFSSLGTVLFQLLQKDFSSLYEPNFNNIGYQNKLSGAFDKVFSELNVTLGSEVENSIVLLNAQYRECDLLEFGRSGERKYLICSLSDGLKYSTLTTFPRLRDDDLSSIMSGARSYKITRLDISKVNEKKLEDFGTKLLGPALSSLLTRNDLTCPDVSELGFPDSALQIGDLVFIVDPTQLTFLSQNGYQSFPTLRTAGTPKIPTMQQVKQVSITLIFPNENSINYQLIPLFAMFKRTPFVNVRNKDICDFFQEIRYGSPFISMALESINVQSIEGFPNSLQVQIGLLPMDTASMTFGLQALRSMSDVKRQYLRVFSSLDKDKQSDAVSKIEKDYLNLLTLNVNKSYDFRESLPFRAFYQAMIIDRDVILDEYGNPVPTVSSTNARVGQSFLIAPFRPKNPGNMLRHYYSTSNQKPIELQYGYIKGEFSGLLRELSKDKRAVIESRYKLLNDIASAMRTPEDFKNLIVASFINIASLYRGTELELNESRAVFQNLAAIHNIDIPPLDDVEIKNPLDYLTRGFTNLFSKGILKLDMLSLGEAFSPDAFIFFKNYLNITKQGVNLKQQDILATISNVQHVGVKEDRFLNKDGVITLNTALDSLYNWAAGDAIKTKNLLNCIESITQYLSGELSKDVVVLDSSGEAGETAKVIRLPIKSESITIDNHNDVITGWSLSFTNKFVPIELQCSKYPFYQHIGSDDINMSLKLVSTGLSDLKNQLSLMSDRVHDTVKIINYAAPELITWMDPCVKIMTKEPHTIWDAFNIKKVVINSSNSSSIDGMPGSWATMLNLSQANFTLEQYHSIQDAKDSNQLEIELSKYIAKFEFERDAQRNIKTDTFKIRTFKNPTGEEITELEDVIRASFVCSEYGKNLESKIAGIINLNNLPKGYEEYKKRLSSFVISEIDEVATGNFKRLISDNPKFAEIIKLIYSRYDELLKAQSDAIVNEVLNQPTNQGFFQKFGLAIIKDWTASNPESGLGLLTALPAMIVGFFSLPVAATFIPIYLGLTTADVELDSMSKQVRSIIDPYFYTVLEEYKKSVLYGFARTIIKDPDIRDAILNSTSKGSSILDQYKKSISFNRIGCYPDFDIPDFLLDDTQSNFIKLSPEFYLYNNLTPDTELLQFIHDSIERDVSAAKMGMMGSIIDMDEIYHKFNDAIPVLSGFLPEVLPGIQEQVLWKNSLDESLDRLQQLYSSMVLGKSILSSAKIDEYVRLFDMLRDKYKTQEEFDKARDEYKRQLTLSGGLIEDKDLFKLDILVAARAKTLIEIVIIYQTINQYLTQKLISDPGDQKSQADRLTEAFKNSNMTTRVKESLINLQDIVTSILKNYDSTKLPDDIKSKMTCMGGLGAYGFNEGSKITTNDKDSTGRFVSLPDVRNLQNSVYNKIGYYIRLNQAIFTYITTKTMPDLDSFPDVGLVQYWNSQNFTSEKKKIELQHQLLNSSARVKDSTIKLYPTFKVYFLESERNVFKQLGQYFLYNAVQSIEIHRSKTMASTTARVILSNVAGTITDRFSFYRESSDWFQSQVPDVQNTFFGTLDIKPGAKILIKMGYASSDDVLDIAFIGKIVEMNVGPQTELICQSFSAQLNQKIVAEKFGMLSSNKGHGDIASATLDMIPGIEGLGILSTPESDPIVRFNGKNSDKFRGSFGDRFLLSNILGRISAEEFVKDNPRDENIYLPYNIVANNYFQHPTFDWVIYDQTVWESLNELSLYHRNTFPTVKLFNTDGLSNLNEIRETIFIGDKAGYYKYTDAYDYSTLDTKHIKEVVQNINMVTEKIFGLKNISQDSLFTITRGSTNTVVKGQAVGTVVSSVLTAGVGTVVGGVVGSVVGSQAQTSAFLKSEFSDMYDLFQDELTAKILALYLYKNMTTEQKSHIVGLITDFLQTNAAPFFGSGPESDLVDALYNLYKLGTIPKEQITTFDFINRSSGNDRKDNFVKIVVDIYNLNKNKNLTFKLLPEEYYGVSKTLDNRDPSLGQDPRYKKLQKHHLLTDTSNIITNNISLSNSFNNVVNVYYFTEPKLLSGNDFTLKDYDKLNVWTMKSFGDLRDENIRTLSSFQKNVDTNWFDVCGSIDSYFGEYQKIKTKDQKSINEYLSKISRSNVDILNLNDPRWELFPSFVVVGVNLLQREVAKMYQGTIEIVGNVQIEPYDIIHIQDYTNDMFGAVEVEDVTHVFTPDGGFRTLITPNLITYDRDPVQLSDLEIINSIFSYSHEKILYENVGSLMGAAFFTTAGILVLAGSIPAAATPAGWLGLAGGAVSTIGGIGSLYNGTVSAFTKQTKFIYDTLGSVIGRDCINFTTLYYHGVPYISGFGGVDYTNLKTVVNHQIAELGYFKRLVAAWDPVAAAVSTNLNAQNLSILGMLSYKYRKNFEFFGNLPLSKNFKGGF